MLQPFKLLFVASLLYFAAALQAQNEIPALVEKPKSDVQITKEVKVRNVVAPIVAHWLEPTKFPQPFWDETSRRAWMGAGYEESEAPRLEPSVPVDFPVGVRIEKVIEDKNALRIVGKSEAVGQLEVLIRQLDQPFRQVEVECHLMAVDSAALKAVPWAWTPSGKTLSGALMREARLGSSFHSILNKWREARQVETLTSPRVIAFDGTAVGLRAENRIISEFQIYDGSKFVKFSPSVGMKSSPAFIESLGLTVFPEIQKDGNIRARIQLSRNLSLGFYKMTIPSPEEKEKLKTAIEKEGLTEENQRKVEEFGWGVEKDRHFLRSAEGIDREITIKDGDTLAFSGFDAKEFWGGWMSKDKARKLRGKTVIAFITMRELRHLEPPVPGT